MARQILYGPMPPPVRSVNTATGDVEVSDRVIPVGSGVTNYAIPLDAAAVYTLTLTENVTLSVTGVPAATSRVVQVRVTASGARTLAFASGWEWSGKKPAALADGSKGILTVQSLGASVVIASWQALGDGS